MKPQLAVIRGCVVDIECNGMIVELMQRVPAFTPWEAPDGNFHFADAPSFAVVSAGSKFKDFSWHGELKGFSLFSLFDERVVFPINDNPGNESWFTAAPRSKPATTKHDTIDVDGMVRS